MKPIYFSGLNGIRAIAALAVLFAHTSQALTLFGLESVDFGTYEDGKPKSFELAQYGVTLFFVLSGFLITYLLLEEKKIGSINIRNFYIRRVLRIWPLYYGYLIIWGITSFIFKLNIGSNAIWLYIFMAANVPLILGFPITYLEHYWSLGVEEQFYSFWPWIIKKSRNVLKIVFSIFLFLISLKVFFRFFDIKYNNGITSIPYEFIHITRFHCMLVGAIGAILYFQRSKFLLRIANNLFSQILVWSVLILVGLNKFHVFSFLDNEIFSVFALVLIIGQIEKEKRIINLDIKIADFIGKISFGIYVIHPLIIFYLSRIISFNNKSIFSYLELYLLVFSSTILCAYLSYNYFEKYFLKIKHGYSTVVSKGSK